MLSASPTTTKNGNPGAAETATKDEKNAPVEKNGHIKEAIRFVSFLGLLALIVFSGKEIKDFVLSLREWLISISLSTLLAIIIPVQIFRRTILPIYLFLGPLSSFFILVIAAHAGYDNGAWIYQGLKLLEVFIIFPVIRYVYTGMISELLDPNKKFWYVSNTWRKLILLYDDCWLDVIRNKNSFVQGGHVVAFLCAYTVNDYSWTFWLATRSEIPYTVYLMSYLPGLIVEYPKTLFKFKVYAGAVSVVLAQGTQTKSSSTDMDEVIASSESVGFFEKLTVEAGFTTWELISFIITVGFSDLWINYVHARALHGCFKRRGRLISEENCESEKNSAVVHAEV